MIPAVRTSTGFEPVTSRYRCDVLTNWAMKPLLLGAGHNTDRFLNAFTRLTSWRGVPEEMISDCGKTCVGTVGELIEHICKWDQNKVQPDTSYRCVKWNFTFWFHWLQQYLPLLNRPIQGYRRHFVKGAKPLGRARGQTNSDAFEAFQVCQNMLVDV